MSNFILIYLIHIIIISYINSVIKYNIEINNERYSLDHQIINNSSKSENPNGELINQNLYLCEDKKDCISCSFLMYQFASCYWDCDHSQCKTEYSSSSFSYTNDLSSIYKLCSSCDTYSNERMNKNCNKTFVIEEKTNDNDNKKENIDKYNNDKNNDDKNNNETNNEMFDYSTIDFKGLLCKYLIVNTYGKSESLFYLNITKNYRYINIFVELDYGLYMRHINLKNNKNYEIDTVGVNSITIYVYTPENYDIKPFSIIYSFKMLKKSTMLQVVIFMTGAIVVIFSILLILIFIELKKGNMVKHGKKEYNLNVNTLIFNKIKYNPNLFEKFNKNCFLCSNDIVQGSFITELKCKKHIYHYVCLLKWVRQNRLDNTNFFCPLCQKDEIQEINGSIISKEDNDKLLTNNKNIILNKELLKKSDLQNIDKITIKIDNNDNKDENLENKKEKENIISENSNIIDNTSKNNNDLINENKTIEKEINDKKNN